MEGKGDFYAYFLSVGLCELHRSDQEEHMAVCLGPIRIYCSGRTLGEPGEMFLPVVSWRQLSEYINKGFERTLN